MNIFKKMNLNIFTLSFKENNNKDFSNSYFETSIALLRISFVLGMLYYAFFAYMDVKIFPEIKLKLFMIRFLYVCPTILIVLLLSFTKNFRKWWQIGASIAIIVSGVGVIYMTIIVSPIGKVDYFPGLLLVLFYAYILIKLRFVWASFSGWFIVVSYIFANTYLYELSSDILFANIFFLATTNLIGMFGSYYLEYYTKKDYYLGKLLKEEQNKVISINQNLEILVDERTIDLENEILEHKKTTEIQRKSLRDIEILNNIAIQFVNFPSDKNIYQFTVDNLHHLLNLDAYIIINSIDSVRKTVTTQAAAGFGDKLDKLSKLLGFNPINKTIDASQILEANLCDKLVLFEGGLFELLLSSVPIDVCKTIEKLFSVKKIYVITLKNGNKYFGNVIIFLKNKNDKIENYKMVETLAQQASIMIQNIEITKKLKVSEQRFKKLSNLTFEGILIHKNGIVVDANESLLKLLGYKLEELVGQDIVAKCAPKEYHKLIRKMILKDTCPPYEIKLINKKGESIPIEVEPRVIYDDGEPFRVAAIRDITKRKLVEMKLIESEAKFRILTETSPLAIMLYQDKKWIYANPAAEELCGYPIAELRNMNFWEFVAPEYQDFIKSIGIKRLNGYNEKTDFEFKIISKTGIEKWVWLNGNIVILKGKNTGLLTITDITSRKRDENSLKKSEKKHRTIIETTSEGFIFTDSDNVIIDTNNSLCNLLGYSKKEILGKSPFDFVDEEGKKILLAQSQKKLNSLHNVFEISLINKNNKKIPVIFNATTIIDDEKKTTGSFAFVTDISERKDTEKQLQKIENLESIGTLAGGIAHDFNNILTGIYGNVSLVQLQLSKDHAANRYLEGIQKSMERAIKLTNQLLTFSKGGAPIKENVQLEKLIIDVVTFDLSGSNVKPIFNIDEDLWHTQADKGQIQQVFSNLAINANQATKNGGKLHISMSNTIIADNEIQDLESGNYIKIIFRDEGSGISKENLDKIFNPYFTTKKTGNGLGLATTYSIIQKHKGHIDIKSEVNIGTTFTILLPAISDVEIIQDSKQTSIEPLLSEKQKGKILVMDDEEMICEIASEMIEMLGFSCATVMDGSEVINAYKESIVAQDPFDIVILDLTIPGGMGGKEAVKHILNMDPKAKVIVSSGYSDNSTMSDHHKSGFVDLINKPYTLPELRQVINKVLQTK